MSENAGENSGGGDATTPVSPSAEQGEPLQGNPEQAPDGGDAGAPAEAPADAGDSAQPVDNAVDNGGDEAKPVWDVATHGALGEDDPRRERYEVIGE